MPRHNFFHEVINSHLALHPGYVAFYHPILQSYLKSGELPTHEFEPTKKRAFFDPDGNQSTPGPDNKDNSSVAVIPIHGFLTKEGTWCNYGGDELAAMVSESMADETVKSIVLDIYSPGGSTAALSSLKAAIQKRTKPIIASINPNAYSAGYYLAAMADNVLAVDEMAQVGSIGVMIEMHNDDELLKKEGITIHRIVPPESSFKNKSWMDAREGNYEMIIKEELSPWAVHFQEHVRSNRPSLNENIEGILEGKTFYAKDAKAYGLIDDIMPFDDIIQFAFEKASRDKKLTSFFN